MVIIGQVSSIEIIVNIFEVGNNSDLEESKNYALYPEDSILIITSKERHNLSRANYGLIPFWTKNPVKYAEAPVEGKIKKDEQNILKKGIIHEPAFRKPIRELRAIIPTDYFILCEGEKSMLFFNESRPFALAGLYDFWKPTIREKNLYTGIAFLTMPAKGIYKECGFTRQPLIIKEKSWKYWLSDISLTEVTNFLDYSSDKLMNGYHTDTDLLLTRKRDKNIIQQKGIYLREHIKLNTREKLKEKFLKRGKHTDSEQNKRNW